MVAILICISAVAVFASVSLAVNNVKLKARNTKLSVENRNLQYELGTTLVNEKEMGKENTLENTKNITKERIDSIRDKFRKVEVMDKPREVSDEELESFYKSQVNSRNVDKKLEK